MRDPLPLLAVAAVLATIPACRGGSEPTDGEGRQAVTAYLTKLVQAYRASDEEVVDPLVTEREGRKLTALIGVKRDLGYVLDAELLELVFVGSERRDGARYVETRERWRYRDRRIGSGEQVGDDSTDAYGLRYRIVRDAGAVKVDEVQFVGEPRVGRTPGPMRLDPRTAHGLPPADGGVVVPAPAASPPSPPGDRR